MFISSVIRKVNRLHLAPLQESRLDRSAGDGPCKPVGSGIYAEIRKRSLEGDETPQ